MKSVSLQLLLIFNLFCSVIKLIVSTQAPFSFQQGNFYYPHFGLQREVGQFIYAVNRIFCQLGG